MSGESSTPAKSRARTVVMPSFGQSAHAQVAITGMQKAFGSNSLAELAEGGVVPTERYEPNYPLARLKPSPKNPRRQSMDAAGVNMETIQKLRKTPDEDLEAWILRQDQFLAEMRDRGESQNNIITWELLFDLSISTFLEGLLQPIVATPDEFIVGGERRYTSCLLAGHDTARVIIRQMAEDVQAIYRLHENMLRTDLNVAETCLGIRALFEKVTGEPLGPKNEQVTVDLIRTVMNCKQTQAYYYLAMCQLEEGDEQLERLVTGYYTSLRTAYEETSHYVRWMKRKNLGLQGTGQQAQGSGAQGNGAQTPQGSGQQAPLRPAPSPRKPSAPAVKMCVPGKSSGTLIIKALASIKELPQTSAQALHALGEEWKHLTDSKRKSKLAEVLDDIFTNLSPLDADQEGNA